MVVLQSLDHNNRMTRLSEIAHRTHTERHNITTLIQRMDKDGLVRIERNKEDRRTVNVSVTDEGEGST